MSRNSHMIDGRCLCMLLLATSAESRLDQDLGLYICHAIVRQATRALARRLPAVVLT